MAVIMLNEMFQITINKTVKKLNFKTLSSIRLIIYISSN